MKPAQMQQRVAEKERSWNYQSGSDNAGNSDFGHDESFLPKRLHEIKMILIEDKEKKKLAKEQEELLQELEHLETNPVIQSIFKTFYPQNYLGFMIEPSPGACPACGRKFK